jgi:hypothetical protein
MKLIAEIAITGIGIVAGLVGLAWHNRRAFFEYDAKGVLRPTKTK